MPSRILVKSKRASSTPDVAVEISIDDRVLDFAFSDNGEQNPERILIEQEEAGDLTIIVTALENGGKKIQFIFGDT